MTLMLMVVCIIMVDHDAGSAKLINNLFLPPQNISLVVGWWGVVLVRWWNDGNIGYGW